MHDSKEIYCHKESILKNGIIFFSENYLVWSRIENVESEFEQNDVNLKISGKQNLIQAFEKNSFDKKTMKSTSVH